MISVKRIVSEYMSSNMYVLSEGEHTILIDPCVKNIQVSKVDAIIATHEHFDHISGVNFWKERTGAKFICSAKCAQGCIDPRKNLSRYFKAFCELQSWIRAFVPADPGDYSCEADETYSDKMLIKWQGHELEVFECPGHSQGGQCILIDGEILFSGDSLINGFKTACNSPGGNIKKWRNYSLPMIKALDREILIYPGHLDSFILKNYDDGTGKFWTEEAVSFI